MLGLLILLGLLLFLMLLLLLLSQLLDLSLLLGPLLLLRDSDLLYLDSDDFIEGCGETDFSLTSGNR